MFLNFYIFYSDSKPKYKLDELCTMLRFALKRFTQLNGVRTHIFNLPIFKLKF